VKAYGAIYLPNGEAGGVSTTRADVAGAELRRGSHEKPDSDLIGTVEVAANAPELVKAIKWYQRKGKLFVAYDAGCLGFDLYHFAVRDFIRGRGDLVDDLTRTNQRI
jgi:hypothetical protein